MSDNFKEASFGNIDFEKQYSSAYFVRLETFRAAVMESARQRWVDSGRIPEKQLVGHVKSYKSGEGDVALIGVIFKEMTLKPNVLTDLHTSLNLADQQLMDPCNAGSCARKLAESDTVFIEDMEARMQLIFASKSVADTFPTGIIMSVLGRVNAQGFFDVSDYVLPQCSIPVSLIPIPNEPVYIALVSGLQIGSPKSNPLYLQLLRDFLMGRCATEQAVNIVRVLVAGDTLFYQSKTDPQGTALHEADIFLAQLASVMPIDIMAGGRDPTNYCLPQQPLHSGLFPEARRFANLNVKSNPYKMKLGDMVMLGTSGQNVIDVLQYTNLSTGLDALELIANSRHLAPTAPDTLACYPFTTTDPLIISDSFGGFPHLVFAGNQAQTASKFIEGTNVRIATVADFSLSASILLVNINNADDVRVIEFSVPDMM